MIDRIHLGFEVETGAEVSIPLHHVAVTGQTRWSGKTTALEALLSRLPPGFRALVFRTKRGEIEFRDAHNHAPFYKEQKVGDNIDWEYVQSVLEAAMKQRLRFERSWIIKASKGAQSLQDVYAYIKGQLDGGVRLRGLDESIWTNLGAYFEKVLPQLGQNPFAEALELEPGLNLMDLGHLHEEVQALVISACLEELAKVGTNTYVVVPEAWKFIPQQRGNPVKWAAQHVIREGGASNLFLALDSQDIAAVEKSILKSVGVWLLGRQMEANEVRRVLTQVPMGKPSAQAIMTLPVGRFYVATESWCRLTYVQPAWLDAETARKVAMGEVPVVGPPAPAEVVPVLPQIPEIVPNTLSGQFAKLPFSPVENCPEEEDPMVTEALRRELTHAKAREDEAERQVASLEKELATERIAGNRAREAEEATSLALEQALHRFSVREAERDIFEHFRDALRAFLCLDSLQQAPGGTAGPVDLDALAGKVATRLGTIRPVVQITPLEALKHGFQQETVGRLVGLAQALEERPRQAILWLLSVGRPAKHVEICRHLAIPEKGGSFVKFGLGIKDAVAAGVLRQDTDGLHVTIREKVVAELDPYNPSPEDIEATYQHLLAALVNGAGESS